MLWKISMKSIFSNQYLMGKPPAMQHVVISAQVDIYLGLSEYVYYRLYNKFC